MLATVIPVPAQSKTVIHLAAAADLQPLLPSLLESFRTQTGIQVTTSYSSSATLATQIENGAPFDLFLSADSASPDRLVHEGLTTEASPVRYARGTLVIWTRNDSPYTSLSVKTLRDPSLESVAIANPNHAPYGRAAVAALHALGLTQTLASKLRTAENIAQAAQFAESGSAQIGLISLTYALSPRLRREGHYIEMPRDSYPPIEQAAVILKRTGHKEEAQAFLKFLLTAPVEKQLQAGGLQPPSSALTTPASNGSASR